MAEIVVVDDDRSIRELVALNLEMSGHRVATATDGPSALDVITSRRPDIVILDIMMPGLDGRTVATAIRSDADLDDVAIIYLTACGTNDDIWKGWHTGADSYVCKPFDPVRLVEEVERVWRGRQVPSDAAHRRDRQVVPYVDPLPFSSWFVADRRPTSAASPRLSGSSL